ncbi:hypothetical protein EFK50_01220 [Nocardioides marmoriginsengisoli]|uniref:Uncharacterized protein n=1 Tax=Nocardioides marmoriginsengisoli TaxID=661483 RepID=A0A3N0CS44_9ACTN|nr:hypothetical protein [Nocardioides marmoriginsengisoli]RNL66277.1 hypothetical protein EFK50_01220 [Nocardioides marmoriginsengisoli]
MSAVTPHERRVVLSQVPLASGRDDDAIIAAVQYVVDQHVAAERTRWATKFADAANRGQADLEAILMGRDKAVLDPVRVLLASLAADLKDAKPEHFSIGLMVGRVKELQAAAGTDPAADGGAT